MRAIVVTIQIKPEHRDAFISAMLEDARSSLANEPGCLRFDVVQDLGDSNRIHLYEVFRDEAAIEAHRQAPHAVFSRTHPDYSNWQHTFDDWFARHCVTLYPPDAEWHRKA